MELHNTCMDSTVTKTAANEQWPDKFSDSFKGSLP